MNALIVTTWANVRGSYWFVPALMAVAAVLLSVVTTTVDRFIGAGWIEGVDWLHVNRPAGARAVLSTVAGSMITVASVTFSMTILSISYTTSQVGPRLLSNFMRDLGNQVTLGVFISTFLYCLLVLRTVQEGVAPVSEMQGQEAAATFVPHLAILVALLLAVFSVSVLIFFIHHVPDSIHVSNIVARVGRDMKESIDDHCSGLANSRDDNESSHQDSAVPSGGTKVRADGDGYIQYIDADSLVSSACEHDLVLDLKCRVGDFVTTDNVLLLASHEKGDVAQGVANELASAFVWGNQRTSLQDLRFQLNQLVEVAIRALSPGVNDPFTAMNCIDWLMMGLHRLDQRVLPSAYHRDKNQTLRLVTKVDTFESLSALVFDQLRPYVASDANVSTHMMKSLTGLTRDVSSESHRRLLIRHGGRLMRESRRRINDATSLVDIRQYHRSMIWFLRSPEYRQRVVETHEWPPQRF